MINAPPCIILGHSISDLYAHYTSGRTEAACDSGRSSLTIWSHTEFALIEAPPFFSIALCSSILIELDAWPLVLGGTVDVWERYNDQITGLIEQRDGSCE